MPPGLLVNAHMPVGECPALGRAFPLFVQELHAAALFHFSFVLAVALRRTNSLRKRIILLSGSPFPLLYWLLCAFPQYSRVLLGWSAIHSTLPILEIVVDTDGSLSLSICES